MNSWFVRLSRGLTSLDDGYHVEEILRKTPLKEIFVHKYFGSTVNNRLQNTYFSAITVEK